MRRIKALAALAMAVCLALTLAACDADDSGASEGSIGGVCYDENSDYDSLRLKEVDAALCSVRGQMSEPYCFSIDDIYDNYVLTDVVGFSVEGDQVTFGG